jgi:hypothetical protein
MADAKHTPVYGPVFDPTGRLMASVACLGERALKTWGDGKRCDECCNGDRCDDPDHVDRSRCPHCKSTGWALWASAGFEDYVRYLQGWRGMSEDEARAAAIAKAAGSAS